MTDSSRNSDSDGNSGQNSGGLDFLQQRINRRKALSTGVGVAAGVVGGLVIGGAAGYLGRGSSTSTSTATVTSTSLSTVTSAVTSTVTSTVTGSASSSSSSSSSTSSSSTNTLTSATYTDKPTAEVLIWTGPTYTGLSPAMNTTLSQAGLSNITSNFTAVACNDTAIVKLYGTSQVPDFNAGLFGYDYIDYINSGFIRDITKVWTGTEFGYDHRPDFDPLVVSTVQFGSPEYWSGPWQSSHNGMFYSNAAVKAAGISTNSGSYLGVNYEQIDQPNSVDDLHDLLVAFQEGGTKIPLAIGEYGGMYGWCWMEFYAMQNGWTAWNDLVSNNASSPGVPTYNDTNAVAALTQWADWVSEGLCGNPANVNATLNTGNSGPQDFNANILGAIFNPIEGTGLSWWPDTSTDYGVVFGPYADKQEAGYVVGYQPSVDGPAGPLAGDEFLDVFMSPAGMTTYETYAAEWPGCNKSNETAYVNGYGATDPNLVKYYVAMAWNEIATEGWTFPGLSNSSSGYPIEAIYNSTAIQGMYASNNPNPTDVANAQQADAVAGWTAQFGSATAAPPTVTEQAGIE